MKTYSKWLSGLSITCASILAAQSASAAALAINEIRTDHLGSDTDEFFELAGTPGESLDGLTYIVIGDTSPSLGSGSVNTGAIEVAIDLTGLVIPADGIFLAVEPIFTGPAGASADLVTNLNFENSDVVTHMLVSGFTGAEGDLIDTDRDGLIDVTPWASIIDGLTLDEQQNSGEFNYTSQLGASVINFPAQAGTGESFQHVYRDVDLTGNWIGGFSQLGQPNETPGVTNILPPPLVGDINGDGFVGIDDLNLVLVNWNNGTPPATGNGTIPEPASLALLGLGGLALLRRRNA
jgi:uncharacterized protein